MKIEQFRHQATTEQLNDRLSKVFGSAIQLDQFTDAQLETARSSVLDKIVNIEQNESFDGLSHNEDYHKQKMFLDVLDSAINDRTVEAKLQNDILIQASRVQSRPRYGHVSRNSSESIGLEVYGYQMKLGNRRPRKSTVSTHWFGFCPMPRACWI